jgi:uncharacterized protein YjiK
LTLRPLNAVPAVNKSALSTLAALAVFGPACVPGDEPTATDGAPSASAAPVVTASVAPADTVGTLPYDFAHPVATADLAAVLREVSGIAVLPDGRLAAVQDEAGVLYTLDAATGAVVAERPFAGHGDYEDVAWAGGAVWVLDARGTLYELPGDGGAAVAHPLGLRKKCDAEGLAFDPAGGRLLVSCKDDPGPGLDGDTQKAVYAFGLATRRLSPTPVVTLDRRQLDAAENFRPSALAVHPRTGQLYVVSSVRNLIAVVDRDGGVVATAELPEALNQQPEGIAFAPDGTLYLANEGPHGPATLATYAERP